MSGYLVDDMRLWWNFPKYPEVRITLHTLQLHAIAQAYSSLSVDFDLLAVVYMPWSHISIMQRNKDLEKPMHNSC